MNLTLYFHTIRHLRPIQIYGRILNLLKRPLIRPVQKKNIEIHFPQNKKIQFPLNQVKMSDSMEFNFLNNKQKIQFEHDWNNSERSQLWNYHLHYFDDLVAENYQNRKTWHLEYIKRWREENPFAVGNGWRPYPLSLRIVNWIKWHILVKQLTQKDLESLYQQTNYLEKNIEYHLQGNHLFVNAKALFLAGLFFQERNWIQLGQKIILEEIEKQILSDGAHFERSPMYHALFVEDILDIIQFSNVYEYNNDFISKISKKVPMLLKFLTGITYPNGDLAQFNDTTQGIAKSTDELLKYALFLNFPIPKLEQMEHFVSSGYVRIQFKIGVLIFDNGKLGPDFLMAHAHADNLSFELFAFGKKCFTNLGIYQYGQSSQRVQERGTSFHNTVEVDEQNSSVVWQSFRVAQRANPIFLNVFEDLAKNLFTIEAAHDGYCRLAGQVIHKRKIEIIENSIFILDSLEGKGEHSCSAFYHLHPHWKVVSNLEDRRITIQDNSNDKIELDFSQKVEIKENFYHPNFGVNIQNNTIKMKQRFKDNINFSVRINLCEST